MPDYLCGLDLGQSGDYTAMAILRRSMALTDEGVPRRNLRGDITYRFECVHLERFKLGTSYPAMVATIASLVKRPPIAPSPRLVVDATGVGRAVVDLFLDERMDATIYPLTITAGDNPRRDRWNLSSTLGYWVPKNELVSSVRASLESGRLKIAKRLQLADTLKKELVEFKVKITKAANETFSAREGTHDDLVLAVAMATWMGEQREIGYQSPAYADVGPNHPEAEYLRVELKREADATAKEAADEAAKREAEYRDPFADHWYDSRGAW